MADFENAEHFVKLLIGVTSVAATGGADLASTLTIVETLGHASKLDKAIGEMGLHDVAKRLAKTAKDVETRLSTNSDFTETSLADATALFQQALQYCIPTPEQVVTNNLSGARIAEWMLAQIDTSPVGRDFRNASQAARYLREVVTPTLNSLVENADFRAKMLEPWFWRKLLDRAEDTNRMVKEIYDDRSKTENPIRLKLTTAQKLASQLGAELPDLFDPDKLETFLEHAAERAADLTLRLRAPSNEDDPVVQRLRKEAAAFVDDGEYDAADIKLTEAEARDAAIEEEHLQTALRSRLSRAKSRAERGDLARLRLQFREASNHYLSAANLVPADEIELRLDYTLVASNILSDYGAEFGVKEANASAIEIIEKLALPLSKLGQSPKMWAETQNELGVALGQIATLETGTGSLFKSAAAFEKAQRVFSRELSPERWAAIQNNIGNSLRQIAFREGNQDVAAKAIAAIREALSILTQSKNPKIWSSAKLNLGIALCIVGNFDGNAEMLKESAEEVRHALSEINPKENPDRWAEAQNEVAVVKQSLGERSCDTEQLNGAIEAFREVLSVRTLERMPYSWADTQIGIGISLGTLGSCTNDSAKLLEAIEAFRRAREVFSRGLAPLAWARAQCNLANAVQLYSEKSADFSRHPEAIALYREVLIVRTRENAPLEWASAQYNLGNALKALSFHNRDIFILDEARVAYIEALKEYSFGRVPLKWADTQKNIAEILLAIYSITKKRIVWTDALNAIDRALGVFKKTAALNDLANALELRAAILAATPTPDPIP